MRIGSLEKLQSCFLGLTDFVGHAAAEIEDDANGNGDVFGREILDLLLDVVFEDTEVIGIKARNGAIIRIGDGNVDKRQVPIDMEGLALLNDLARCVMLHVVGDGGLGGRQRVEIPDDDAKEKKRNERNEGDTSCNQTTFHKISIVPNVIVLNLKDWCPFLDHLAQDLDKVCSHQILQSSHRHR